MGLFRFGTFYSSTCISPTWTANNNTLFAIEIWSYSTIFRKEKFIEQFHLYAYMLVSVENKTDFPVRNSSCDLHCHICKKIVKRPAVNFFFFRESNSATQFAKQKAVAFTAFTEIDIDSCKLNLHDKWHSFIQHVKLLKFLILSVNASLCYIQHKLHKLHGLHEWTNWNSVLLFTQTQKVGIFAFTGRLCREESLSSLVLLVSIYFPNGTTKTPVDGVEKTWNCHERIRSLLSQFRTSLS